MNPDPGVSQEFGRTAAQAARAAGILALLGAAAVFGVERYLTREGTPLGDALSRSGIPPHLPMLAGGTAVLAAAVLGCWRSIRGAPRFRITGRGLHVSGALGSYLLAWENVREAAVTSAGFLGINVRDRGAVVATHNGTPDQREWLRTLEPYGSWDFLYSPAELGRSGQEVLSWMAPFLQREGPG